MSNFTTPACLEMLDDYKWLVLSPFQYHVGIFPSDQVINIPQGTITDLASVPRALWTFFPPHGKWAKAAIIHDYLYAHGIGSKAYADSVFLEAMGVLGVPRVTKYLMYFSVRFFGKGNYGV